MFNTYRLKNSVTDEEFHIAKWSYVWACMFGPFYVAVKAGPGCVIQSALLSLACSAMLFMLLVNLNRVPQSLQPIILIFGVLTVLLIHSIQTISFILKYYRKQRRWSVRMT